MLRGRARGRGRFLGEPRRGLRNLLVASLATGPTGRNPFASHKIKTCRLDPSTLTTDTIERLVGAPGTDIPILLE